MQYQYHLIYLLWLVPPLALLVAGGIRKAWIHRGEAHHHHGFGHKHGEGTLSIDMYAYHSKIGGWNAKLKIGYGMLLLLICLISNDPYVSFGVILYTFF